MTQDRSAAQPSRLVRCDGGDGLGCFIPHARCVCEDEGSPGLRRAALLYSPLHTFACDLAVAEDGSYGPKGNATMSERISLSYEELEALVQLISEAREGMDEDATEDEIAVYSQVTTKVGRAFAKARRKRETS